MVTLNAYDSFPCKKTSAFGVSVLVLRKTVVIPTPNPATLGKKICAEMLAFLFMEQAFPFLEQKSSQNWKRFQ